jgi:tetraacyldisaccharide 4'-kinase
MLEESDAPKVVVLDDAYQHRYITAGLYILLTDYARPYFSDHVLPAGRLREARSGAKRADIIVVTKCPGDLSETEQQHIRKCLRLLPHQSLFFSKMEYGVLWNPFSEADPLTHGTNVNAPICKMRTLDALLVCGIAHPEEFVKYFQAQCASVNVLSFLAHHRFTTADISAIADRAQDADIIITTQKDWARLSDYDLPDVIKQKLCVQPIEVKFLHQTENTFNQIILDYVTKDSTNSRMD